MTQSPLPPFRAPYAPDEQLFQLLNLRKTLQKVCTETCWMGNANTDSVYYQAWERGIKSLYYCRSKSVQRAGFAGVDGDNTRAWCARPLEANGDKYDECLACQ